MEIIIGREEGARRLHCTVSGREFNIGQAGTVPLSVSRRHCKISVNGSNISIENIKAQNVTFVDGNQVVSKGITTKSRVQLGEERFLVPLQQILQLAGVSAANGVDLQKEAPTFSLKPALFSYYKASGSIRPDCNIEAVIDEMKPWYDNYCFSEDALHTQSRVFNCDMVLYYLRNYISRGEGPKEMIDPNTKTDYNKMKRLIQLDKLDGDRKGVIRTIAETGEIACNLYETFPAHQITDPKIFPSLLFYYGMLTIKNTRGAKLLMTIPNNNVRKQYYGYLQEMFEEKAYVDTELLTDYYYDMAYDGKWNEGLQFMANAYAKVSSVRDGIEAERNLQGFFMAYLNLNAYYYTAPELELNHGFCDFFLLPDLTHYATKHSYILELKLLHKGDTEATAQKQWDEAVTQINAYAQAPRVEALRQGTQLHKIIMQFDRHQLHRMEEVRS